MFILYSLVVLVHNHKLFLPSFLKYNYLLAFIRKSVFLCNSILIVHTSQSMSVKHCIEITISHDVSIYIKANKCSFPGHVLQLFTVVKNVKEAHECQEHGETQEFDDDIEYLLAGIEAVEPMSTRCLR